MLWRWHKNPLCILALFGTFDPSYGIFLGAGALSSSTWISPLLSSESLSTTLPLIFMELTIAGAPISSINSLLSLVVVPSTSLSPIKEFSDSPSSTILHQRDILKLAIVGLEVIVMKNHNNLFLTIHFLTFSPHNNTILESIVRLKIWKCWLDESWWVEELITLRNASTSTKKHIVVQNFDLLPTNLNIKMPKLHWKKSFISWLWIYTSALDSMFDNESSATVDKLIEKKS